MAKTNIDNRHALILLNMVPGLGPIKIKNLARYFEQPQNVFQAREKDLLNVEAIKTADAREIVSFDQTKLAEELKRADLAQVKIITILDSDYPARLGEIYAPPPVLYVKGDSSIFSRPGIAIVGSRLASIYGMQAAEKLASQLAALGMVVVSGMARGIDKSAHQGALKSKGKTIAVLGTGMNIIYPRENEKLFHEISGSGAVISEFPLDMPPQKSNFPQRNRLISGLSLGVVVVEAALRSGALITANIALEQNREVFAVPGNINSRTSAGTNALIKEGAKLVNDITDIVSEFSAFNWGGHTNGAVLPPAVRLDSPEKEKIFSLLDKDNPTHIDTLIFRSRFPAQRVATILSNLEISGCVRQLEGKNFIRAI